MMVIMHISRFLLLLYLGSSHIVKSFLLKAHGNSVSITKAAASGKACADSILQFSVVAAARSHLFTSHRIHVFSSSSMLLIRFVVVAIVRVHVVFIAVVVFLVFVFFSFSFHMKIKLFLVCCCCCWLPDCLPACRTVLRCSLLIFVIGVSKVVVVVVSHELHMFSSAVFPPFALGCVPLPPPI